MQYPGRELPPVLAEADGMKRCERSRPILPGELRHEYRQYLRQIREIELQQGLKISLQGLYPLHQTIAEYLHSRLRKWVQVLRLSRPRVKTIRQIMGTPNVRR